MELPSIQPTDPIVPGSTPPCDETLALLRQIAQDTAEQKRHARKAALAARIQTGCVAGILLALILVILWAGPRLRTTLNMVDTGLAQLNQVTATLAQVDFVAMGNSITALAVNGNESLAAAMTDLQSTMLGVRAAIDTVAGIDVKNLNDSIASLSAILEPMARFFGKR